MRTEDMYPEDWLAGPDIHIKGFEYFRKRLNSMCGCGNGRIALPHLYASWARCFNSIDIGANINV